MCAFGAPFETLLSSSEYSAFIKLEESKALNGAPKAHVCVCYVCPDVRITLIIAASALDVLLVLVVSIVS